jgi:hypothetical protein
MQITPHKEHGLRLPALMSSKPVLFSALIISLLPVQLFAQKLQVAYWTGPVALVPPRIFVQRRSRGVSCDGMKF